MDLLSKYASSLEFNIESLKEKVAGLEEENARLRTERTALNERIAALEQQAAAAEGADGGDRREARRESAGAGEGAAATAAAAHASTHASTHANANANATDNDRWDAVVRRRHPAFAAPAADAAAAAELRSHVAAFLALHALPAPAGDALRAAIPPRLAAEFADFVDAKCGHILALDCKNNNTNTLSTALKWTNVLRKRYPAFNTATCHANGYKELLEKAVQFAAIHGIDTSREKGKAKYIYIPTNLHDVFLDYIEPCWLKVMNAGSSTPAPQLSNNTIIPPNASGAPPPPPPPPPSPPRTVASAQSLNTIAQSAERITMDEIDSTKKRKARDWESDNSNNQESRNDEDEVLEEGGTLYSNIPPSNRCRQCFEEFPNASKLREHYYNFHAQEPLIQYAGVDAPITVRRQNGKLLCPCGVSYKSTEALARHATSCFFSSKTPRTTPANGSNNNSNSSGNSSSSSSSSSSSTNATSTWIDLIKTNIDSSFTSSTVSPAARQKYNFVQKAAFKFRKRHNLLNKTGSGAFLVPLELKGVFLEEMAEALGSIQTATATITTATATAAAASANISSSKNIPAADDANNLEKNSLGEGVAHESASLKFRKVSIPPEPSSLELVMRKPKVIMYQRILKHVLPQCDTLPIEAKTAIHNGVAEYLQEQTKDRFNECLMGGMGLGVPRYLIDAFQEWLYDQLMEHFQDLEIINSPFTC
ncbi:hypothetical protein BDR26DRAFT_920892 [Obelidium mucronatum]|nr:hypothetical protein BDR26DRAFT_920892 [Obelidium mucronatum]